MKRSTVWLLVAARLLGAALSLFALLIAAFASDSGAQDPVGQRASQLMSVMPIVFLVCAVVSEILARARRDTLALVVANVPILYFGAAILLVG